MDLYDLQGRQGSSKLQSIVIIHVTILRQQPQSIPISIVCSIDLDLVLEYVNSVLPHLNGRSNLSKNASIIGFKLFNAWDASKNTGWISDEICFSAFVPFFSGKLFDFHSRLWVINYESSLVIGQMPGSNDGIEDSS
jgi:hypothetical protein